ncbi:MAG: hypothetical protein WB711_14170 [Terriglobales bacterium]
MKTIEARWEYLSILALLVLVPCLVQAQQGDNAVWASRTSIQGSGALVDVAAFCGSGGSSNCSGTSFDFCAALNTALTNLTTLSPAGGVADARGVVPAPTAISSGGGSQHCNSNPFSGIAATNSVPITVLLPASVIKMNATWTLPNNVRLVGEGGYTNLEDQSSTFTGSNLITMGPPGCSSSSICSGISVEHIKLSQVNHSLGGIVNEYAEQSSYVNDVDMENLSGTGLLIEAPNSGPYTNLTFTANSGASCSGSSCPLCVDIEAQTQGLHGMTCLGNAATGAYTPGSDVSAGIRVNAGNNSIENIHTEAFWDGIRIGDVSRVSVSNIIVSNVDGSKQGGGLTVTNIVHICGALHSSQYGMCPQYSSVANVTILGATDVDNTNATSSDPCSSGTVTCSTAIQDDVTGVSIAAPLKTTVATGISAGFYALGGEIGSSSGIYSQFATTPTYFSQTSGTPTPSWGEGNTAVSGLSCNTLGALYSYTGAGSGADSVYVCTGGSTPTWTSIP